MQKAYLQTLEGADFCNTSSSLSLANQKTHGVINPVLSSVLFKIKFLTASFKVANCTKKLQNEYRFIRSHSLHSNTFVDWYYNYLYMKKDLLTHFSFMVALFVMISLYKDWLRLEFLPFWFGGILGTLLPDIDHLIYVYVIKPTEATSQKVAGLVSERKVLQSWDILAKTRGERKELIFHTAHFQIIFLIFAIFVITSSGSLLGTGLVLAFILHLLIDQIIDLMESNSLDNWFKKFPFTLDDKQKRWFVLANGILLLVFGFLY